MGYMMNSGQLLPWDKPRMLLNKAMGWSFPHKSDPGHFPFVHPNLSDLHFHGGCLRTSRSPSPDGHGQEPQQEQAAWQQQLQEQGAAQQMIKDGQEGVAPPQNFVWTEMGVNAIRQNGGSAQFGNPQPGNQFTAKHLSLVR